MHHPTIKALESLGHRISGDIYLDSVQRRIYANDASVYQSLPLAVAIPKTENDIRELILLANEHRIGLIPRTAGTSLAGQVVGNGIVVDVSRHLTRVVEINKRESWVRVQPGVIRDELNFCLAEHELFFAPETSTSNRAMIGGMLGNNSCGANSIVYGSTRDHVIEVTGFLSDGSRATFGPITQDGFFKYCESNGDSLESQIYRQMNDILSPRENQNEIRRQFPKPSIRRRNTGYAIDCLLDSKPFGGDHELNLSKLISGSEGTLFFATEIKLNCVSPPPRHVSLLCAHFESLKQALKAAQISMSHQPHRCELVDDLIIEGARRNIDQARHAEFVIGDPAAFLLIEFREQTQQTATQRSTELANELRVRQLGYEYPILDEKTADQAWELRRAGLGVAYNLPGNIKPVTVIEDAAVELADLPDFIEEVDDMLEAKFGLNSVHYAHAGAGELHLRPNLNLKDRADQVKFRQIAEAVAAIVKKYQGSLSGEHGDGRLRSEFISSMIGDRCYQWIKQIKNTWDPDNIFNPGKIVDSPPMDDSLRSSVDVQCEAETVFRFDEGGSLLGAVEKCSGLGDCRKTHLAGGTMCPSYMATRNEKDTTRARANLLRQLLADGESADLTLRQSEAKEILDLCMSCKGCKSECPSNVDMAKIKAEFMQGYYDQHGTPLKQRALASIGTMLRLGSLAPRLANLVSAGWLTSASLKRVMGIHASRSMPRLHPMTLRSWFRKKARPRSNSVDNVVLFCDEFTNYLDVPAGIAAIELLEGLGYQVALLDHVESGRVAISSGLLRPARKFAEENVRRLHEHISNDRPLIGIEPSALLTFRDEYPDLVDRKFAAEARKLASNTLLIDEFLDREAAAGRIDEKSFSVESRQILLHGHCHQKALSSIESAARVLSLPANHDVTVIPSGCCGMAGFFGYENNHFDLSMQIGELVLFPAIRSASSDSLIAATGTSCRHQIFDGTGRIARHPVEILRGSLLAN